MNLSYSNFTSQLYVFVYLPNPMSGLYGQNLEDSAEYDPLGLHVRTALIYPNTLCFDQWRKFSEVLHDSLCDHDCWWRNKSFIWFILLPNQTIISRWNWLSRQFEDHCEGIFCRPSGARMTLNQNLMNWIPAEWSSSTLSLFPFHVSAMPDISWFLFRTLLTSIIHMMGVQLFCSLNRGIVVFGTNYVNT